jgi:hypothetical protein
MSTLVLEATFNSRDDVNTINDYSAISRGVTLADNVSC